jgi:hypothetical protein
VVPSTLPPPGHLKPGKLQIHYTKGENGGPVPHTIQGVLLGAATSNVSWTFGDGGRSNTSDFIHTYTLPGDFIIKATVISSRGVESISDAITVGSPKPTPKVTDVFGRIGYRPDSPQHRTDYILRAQQVLKKLHAELKTIQGTSLKPEAYGPDEIKLIIVKKMAEAGIDTTPGFESRDDLYSDCVKMFKTILEEAYPLAQKRNEDLNRDLSIKSNVLDIVLKNTAGDRILSRTIAEVKRLMEQDKLETKDRIFLYLMAECFGPALQDSEKVWGL